MAMQKVVLALPTIRRLCLLSLAGQKNSALTVVQYGAAGGFPLTTDPGPQDRGKNFFAGGPYKDNNGNNTTTMTQNIDVSAFGIALDTGKVPFTLSGYLGGYTGQDDNATLTIEFLGGLNKVLGQAHIGPVLGAERQSATALLQKSTTGVLPAGTRTIKVTLLMTKPDASDGDSSYNDGYADNLSLIPVSYHI